MAPVVVRKGGCVARRRDHDRGAGWDQLGTLASACPGGRGSRFRRTLSLRPLHQPHRTQPDALELWSSLTWLADHTSRIEFGPLVSPVSFRHPVITAWTAAAVNDLAGGRLRLGLGAGWQEREHRTYGFELLDTDRRFARFEEGLEVITRLLRNEESVSFVGEFYRLHDAGLTPSSTITGVLPIVIGGNGPNRTLPL
jgi:alkanesulfonate monooxygenase SsuD/methylene tetrahydromethanopterin reductase-like flavin-dependent oxidoreductase (luciferase family)